MADDVHEFPEIAVSSFQAQMTQAMENAGAQIVATRTGKEVDLEAQHQTENLLELMRAEKTIRGIPRLFEQITRNRLAFGLRQKSARYDCWVEVMRLNELESSEKPNVPNPRYWYTQMPDPSKLLHAARLVFDFCERAGFHVVVARNIQEGAIYGYFCIDLYWNIPPALWQLAKPKIEFESPVAE